MDSVTIANSDGNPKEMFVHSSQGDYISEVIKFTKMYYEIQLLVFLKSEFPVQQMVVDIGANIGNHSKFFWEEMKVPAIVAFEPVVTNAKLFRANNPCEKIVLHQIALSSEKTVRTLYNTGEGSFGGFSFNREPHSYVVSTEIPTATLDSFELKGVTLIKIDVENHENSVLEGAKNTILLNKPVIVLENSYYHFPNNFPIPEPHSHFMQSVGYVKIHSNVKNTGMDVWKSL